MRNLNKILGTGCFFLCLGGWVYDGQMIRADSASVATPAQAAISAAVASAAAPGATDAPASANVTAESKDTPTAAAPEVKEVPAAADPVANHALAAGDSATGAGAGTAESAGSSNPNKTTATKAEPSTNLNASVVNVGVDGVVEQVSFQDLDLGTALHFLSLQSKRNIITSKEVTAAKATVTANLYNVTFNEALDSLLKPNGFDYVEKGNFIYVYTVKELDEIRKRDHKTANHIYHLHYLTAKDAAVLIKPLMSSAGVVALTPDSTVGLPTGVTDTGGMAYTTDDTLVINDYPENLAQVEHGLKDLDVRPKQVLVESTILNTSLSDDSALGVDLVSLSGLDFGNIGSIISPVTSTTSGSTSGSTTGSTSTAVTTPGQLAGTLLPGVAGTSSNQTSVGTNFANAVPPGGLSIGFLSNHVSAFVRALESVTNTSVVANPKILTLNKQHGEVLIGKKLGYLTTTTSTTTTDQTVQFIDVGTKLVFRPFIGDNGYIRMEIHPEDSSGTIDSKGIPQKATTEVTSNVMIKDGRTIVIGGLFREAITGSRGQVPVLGNIPILGIPFRQTADDTERTETIVLITPHVINDDTALYDESEKEAADIHRQMLGNRAGLQPWSRDRIAQLWYSKALEQLDKGCQDKAIMYADWALSTQPQFIEAIRLRERLTNKKMEEASQSSIHGFVCDVLKSDAANIPDPGSSGHYPPPEAPATMPATPAAPTPAK